MRSSSSRLTIQMSIHINRDKAMDRAIIIRIPKTKAFGHHLCSFIACGSLFDNEAPNTKANQAIQLDQEFKECNINIVAEHRGLLTIATKYEIGQRSYKPIEKRNFFQHQGQQR
ncbi:hypothetical protein Nepgr_028336 [Nepenthes gracilis]|uniref:Uncharacterized protein n=1 Tax=Nepenthes gracilis TaxID=150966 RepID=A0AAD3TAH1_NEPGR|nr:hypothetical protein Nepgr_028336 [Nepenthes gracilis]